MTAYAETLSRHRRLTILRHLEGLADYTSNASILRDICDAVAVTSTLDQVLTDIAWLAEQGLVTRVEHGDYTVATATTRGCEIARGDAMHPGVQRPRPRA